MAETADPTPTPVAGRWVLRIQESTTDPLEGLKSSWMESVTAPLEEIKSTWMESITAPLEGLKSTWMDSVTAPLEGLKSTWMESITAPLEGLASSYVQSITGPLEGLAFAHMQNITAPFEGLASTYMQSVTAPLKVIKSAPEELEASMSGRLVGGISDWLENAAKFGSYFNDLSDQIGGMLNLGASLNLGNALEHWDGLAPSGLLNIENLVTPLPSSRIFECLLPDTSSLPFGAPKVFPSEPSIDERALEVLRDLRHEVRTRRTEIDTSTATVPSLLRELTTEVIRLKSEVIGQRQDYKPQRSLRIASLVASIVLIVLTAWLAVLRA
jgi:hypothetical protein